MLKKDIDILYKWSSKWLLNFNESKCKVMHLEKKNPRHDYNIGNTTLDKVSEESDLGGFFNRGSQAKFTMYRGS